MDLLAVFTPVHYCSWPVLQTEARVWCLSAVLCGVVFPMILWALGSVYESERPELCTLHTALHGQTQDSPVVRRLSEPSRRKSTPWQKLFQDNPLYRALYPPTYRRHTILGVKDFFYRNWSCDFGRVTMDFTVAIKSKKGIFLFAERSKNGFE